MTTAITPEVVPWTPDFLRQQMGGAISVDEPLPHNWMYSFSPGRLSGFDFDNNHVSEIGVWLVGFCKLCRTVFSVPVPLGTHYQSAVVDVPKTGCIPYEENRLSD